MVWQEEVYNVIEEPKNAVSINDKRFEWLSIEYRMILLLGQNIQNKGVCFYDEIFSAVG